MFLCVHSVKRACRRVLLWSMAVVLCTSVGIAQTQALSFSSAVLGGMDGFNNGNFTLASTVTVPLTLGVFDTQTALLSPLATDTELTIDLLDAQGNPSPELFVAEGRSIAANAGASVVFSSLKLVWTGNDATTATLVARSTNGMLLPASISLVFDPALPSDLHVVTVLLHDVNKNGIADIPDTRITLYKLAVQPLAMEIEANADDIYPLHIPQYSGGFPLHLYPVHGSGWRPLSFDRSEGIAIENAAADTTFILMEPASMVVDFSGIRHELFGGVIGTTEDSVLTLSNFSTTSSLSFILQAPHWYATGLATPVLSSAEASFSVAAFCTHDMSPWRALGTLAVACSSGVETLTPDFSASGSATYSLAIYNNGEEVYTDDNLSDAAVVLPRTVRRWGVEGHSFVVEELFPREIGVVNGVPVIGDRIVLTPQDVDASLGDLSAIEITGVEMESLALYKHELRLFDVVETCTGNALFNGVQSAEEGVQIVGGATGGAVFAPLSASAKSLAVQWTVQEPVVPSAQAWVTIEARTADESLSLGKIALFRDGTEMFSCRTLLSSYGGQERTISVYNGGELVATVTTTDEIAAQYGVLPTECSATTQYGKQGYNLFWDSVVEMTLPDAQHVEGDQLMVSFRAVNRLNLLLQDIAVLPRDNEQMRLIPRIPSIDTLLLTATITIISEVFDDKNGDKIRQSNEMGRPGRRVFIYGSKPTEIDTVITNNNGVYQAVYTNNHWAPERVELEYAQGWVRTTPNYNLVAMGINYSHDTTLTNLHFGERDKSIVFVTSEIAHDGGINDDFDAAQFDEPTSTSAPLDTWLAEGEHPLLGEFDIIPHNQWFGYSLPLSDTAACIATGATITLHLRAGQSLSYNDAIVIQQDGQRLWSSPIAALATSHTWFAGRTETLLFNLTALPQGDGTTLNLQSALQGKSIDLLISDDTGIDYFTYVVALGCEPPSSTLLTGIDSGEKNIFNTRLFPIPNAGVGTVEFSLTQNEVTTISLVDMLQKEVLRIVDAKPLPMGKHILGFSFPALPSGTYFLRIAAGAVVASHRLILLR